MSVFRKRSGRQRLAESRGYSQERITSVLKRQLSEEEFRRRSDVVIENDGTMEELRSEDLIRK